MQEDNIFQLVGETLVENYLAWFNSSVFAYGQVLFRLLLFLFYFVRQEAKRLKPFGVWPIPCWKKKHIQWSRLNPLCFWETLCPYKWISYLLSSLKLISFYWTIVQIFLFCIILLNYQISQSNILQKLSNFRS